MAKYLLPVGVSDYRNLVTYRSDDDVEYLYADKSLFIKFPPFLLIDEYDIPIQSAYMQDYYGEMAELMRGIFESALKDNVNITKAVLTGITRVAKDSLFSGVNNMVSKFRCGFARSASHCR